MIVVVIIIIVVVGGGGGGGGSILGFYIKLFLFTIILLSQHSQKQHNDANITNNINNNIPTTITIQQQY